MFLTYHQSKFVLLFLLICSSNFLNGQSIEVIEIKGELRDEKTNEPLIGLVAFGRTSHLPRNTDILGQFSCTIQKSILSSSPIITGFAYGYKPKVVEYHGQDDVIILLKKEKYPRLYSFRKRIRNWFRF